MPDMPWSTAGRASMRRALRRLAGSRSTGRPPGPLDRLCLAAEGFAHRHGRCLVDPPSWSYRVGIGPWQEWPDQRLNLGNQWWAVGQRVGRRVARAETGWA